MVNSDAELDVQSPTFERWHEKDVELDMDGFDLDGESSNEGNGNGDDE